jgi:ABC-2 type transport system permease protein
LLAAAGGVVVLFLIQFMIATMGFWLEAIFGFRDIIVTIDSLFAGRMIPLSALPGLIATISQWLPFQFTLYVPVAIYMGKFSSAGLFGALGLEALWIAVLFGASRLLWRRGLVKYASQGG